MILGKGPVYKLDRADKARMIEAVLTAHLERTPVAKRILDIGCGNGDISRHFSKRNQQYGVDIEDKRRPENQNFQFALVTNEELPFKDAEFDIVLSHHVIEHVDDQDLHLAQIRRVLKPNGIAYLATPNKSSPIMRGHKGNNRVLHYRDMIALFQKAGFVVTEYSDSLIKEPKRFHSEIRGLWWLPIVALKALRPMYPSHIFILSQTVTESE